MMRRRQRSAVSGQRGFTLLEVLVAVAILGLGLTAILSAQFSAVAGVSHARYINMAVGLARCKMTEVEDSLRVNGFQELDQQENGACCEGDDGIVYSCTWSVEKPVFPPPNFGELNLDAELDQNALGKLAETSESGALPGTSTPGAPTDLSSLAAGGVGGVAQMVMGLVYPDLKSLFEASTRRVTVVVSWREGQSERDLTLMQWITQPQEDPNAIANALNEANEGATPGTGTAATGESSTKGSGKQSGGKPTTGPVGKSAGMGGPR